ncbi:MAG TPA: hypothetical protein VHZ29_02365 [Rhizomicrobium sp.]|nr:hypothetical protein [Rhizomicrobium sp.]
MKKIAALAAVLTIGTSTIAPAVAQPAPICLQTSRIDHTTVVDPRTILFRMKDGKVYRNNLRNACIGLKFNGFSYVLRGTDELCGDAQAIRVLQTNETCLLGKFVPETVGQHT